MLSAVQLNTAPNLLILNYDLQWTIRTLVLVPSVFFTESVLERRSPLSEKARRAGWVGCNILLSNVPEEAKIPLIVDEHIAAPSLVREKFRQHQKLQAIDWQVRGWTLDVLKIAHRLGKSFTLQQMYEHESELFHLHPANRNIRPKIRQQLQVLRDLKYLEFIGNGQYQFREQ